MYRSLNEYIARLEREGELVRIGAPVSPVEEIAEMSPICSIIVAKASGMMVMIGIILLLIARIFDYGMGLQREVDGLL